MTPTYTEPILQDWIIDQPVQSPTAADLARRLARIEVTDLDPPIVPYLAAAAAELAAVAGTPWKPTADALPVALLRMIARVGIVAPDAGGPHTARLCALLA